MSLETSSVATDTKITINMSEALRCKEDAKSIFIGLDKSGKASVHFSGDWDGFELRGAIRAIEQQYKEFKRGARLRALKDSKEARS